MLWPLEDTVEVMRWYRRFITKAPRDINGFFAFLTVPPGPPFPEPLHLKKMCGIVWCYTGPIKKAAKVFKPIRAFKPPALDLVGPLPHPALQSMFDALYPPGHQWYWKADFVHELSDEAIARHLEHGSRLPTMLSTMHLYPIDGAAARVKNKATAWAYRDAKWASVIVGVGVAFAELGSRHVREAPRALHANRRPPMTAHAEQRPVDQAARFRRKAQNRQRHPDVQRLSWTVAEWCAAHGISRSYYEKMQREGRGPRELRDGKIVRITPAADAEWTAAREGNQPKPD